ncbi:unnamed protein product [Mytilus coruscus]|uniref:Uncharacterized protein n=1 Tax=Mytilus coruscus TaxID=42192 RepID=A0A6J8BSR3_MYTCO|nr:unnamed protein product [Mytilus coruscus]
MQIQQLFRLTAPQTPTFHQRLLPDFGTPSRDERTDTPVTQSILPTTATAPTTIRSVPMHLFTEIPDGALQLEVVTSATVALSVTRTNGCSFRYKSTNEIYQPVMPTSNAISEPTGYTGVLKLKEESDKGIIYGGTDAEMIEKFEKGLPLQQTDEMEEKSSKNVQDCFFRKGGFWFGTRIPTPKPI